MSFFFGEEKALAPPDTFLLVPPGTSHGFTNEGRVPARMLNTHAPAGFDRRIGLAE
jgi:mannose-6-phosphate isomerase-like protein (cupin superfamily)